MDVKIEIMQKLLKIPEFDELETEVLFLLKENWICFKKMVSGRSLNTKRNNNAEIWKLILIYS